MNSQLIFISMGLVGVMAGPCGDWEKNGGKCPAGSEPRDSDDGHSCASTCDEFECCGYKCSSHFKGNCGATEELRSGHRIYSVSWFWDDAARQAGSSKDKQLFAGKAIDWSKVGAGVMGGCCAKTCRSAKKATCPAGHVWTSEGCESREGKAMTAKNPSGLVTWCDKPSQHTSSWGTKPGCCEKETCVHSTCNLMSDFTVDCAAHGANKCDPDCKDPTTKAQFDKCAICVNVAAAHKQCVPCVKCYGLLTTKMDIANPPGYKGTTSSSNVIVASTSTLFVSLVAALLG